MYFSETMDHIRIRRCEYFFSIFDRYIKRIITFFLHFILAWFLCYSPKSLELFQGPDPFQFQSLKWFSFLLPFSQNLTDSTFILFYWFRGEEKGFCTESILRALLKKIIEKTRPRTSFYSETTFWKQWIIARVLMCAFYLPNQNRPVNLNNILAAILLL